LGLDFFSLQLIQILVEQFQFRSDELTTLLSFSLRLLGEQVTGSKTLNVVFDLIQLLSPFLFPSRTILGGLHAIYTDPLAVTFG